MNTHPSASRKNEYTHKANRYCIAALLSLSAALFILSVGVFLLNPVSVVGIVSTGLGVACALLYILFFVLYSHYLRQAEKDQ